MIQSGFQKLASHEPETKNIPKPASDMGLQTFGLLCSKTRSALSMVQYITFAHELLYEVVHLLALILPIHLVIGNIRSLVTFENRATHREDHVGAITFVVTLQAMPGGEIGEYCWCLTLPTKADTAVTCNYVLKTDRCILLMKGFSGW